MVARLRSLLRQWGIDHFPGENSPENRKSAAFFTRILGAVRIGSTVREGNAWDIYAARAGDNPVP